jgi:hypothetical protein
MPDRPSKPDPRVIAFPRQIPGSAQRLQETSPVGDLRKFEQTQEDDDYRHRMAVNIAAGAVTLLLIIAGLWLADKLSTMRKDQDCVLSGRRGCTPVEAPVQPRGMISSPQ